MATARVSRGDSTRDTRRRRRIVWIIVAAVLAVVVTALAWLAFRVLQAKDELEAAVAASDQLTAAAGDADIDGARDAVSALSRHSAAAASVATDPVWRGAELLPWLGPNLSAVRTAADQTHSIASDVAAPLLDLAERLADGTKPAGALLDIAVLAESRKTLAAAEEVVDEALDELVDIDTRALLPPVADGVKRLTSAVKSARPLVAAAADAGAVLPAMLGADGPRTILVMLQNNAELRTGGGITGTFIALEADQGVLTVSKQADSSDFRPRSTPIVPIPASTEKLYGSVVGRFVQDTSLTPDFPLTAQLASAWWEQYAGSAPDAVVSIDPIVLRAVLEVSGPIPTPAGELDADNMVDMLLVEPYFRLDQKQQTAMFTKVVRSVFTALTGGDLDTFRLAEALAAPIAQGRVSAWSAHPDEQSVLATTALAGPAARQQAAGRHAYAVYLNDTTGGKMDTFLDVDFSTGVGACREDHRRTVEVTVTLTNTAPTDAGRRFPPLMTGGGNFGIPAGHIGTTVAVSAPARAFIGGVAVDGELAGQVDAEDAGFPVSAYSVDLAPGETTTLAFRFIAPDTTDITPTVLHTPLIVEPSIGTHTVDCG